MIVIKRLSKTELLEQISLSVNIAVMCSDFFTSSQMKGEING